MSVEEVAECEAASSGQDPHHCAVISQTTHSPSFSSFITDMFLNVKILKR